jgi:hypothetical protein
MHGCNRLAFTFLLLLAGCTESPDSSTPNPSGTPVLGEAFAETDTGTLEGSVTWQGDLPDIPRFKVFGLPGNYAVDVRKDQPNPNRPRIETDTGAIQDAVVFLRHVDLRKSKPWDQPAVHVDQRDRRIVIRQGDVSSSVGFVRAGSAIEMNSQDDHFHMLRGRGAAFFSVPFANPKVPGHRRLDKPGVIELSSGAFFFWMRGYLFVDHHPYYARTDSDGKFMLDKVPAGEYELVCWLPNWEVAKKSRDPETGLIIQVDFQPPVEHVQNVVVKVGRRQEAAFAWSLGDFVR